MKDKRKNRATKLLSKHKYQLRPKLLCFLSDEENFRIRWWTHRTTIGLFCLSPQDVVMVMKTKYSVHIMVFGVVTSDSDVMLTFIFPHGLRHNTKAYIKCLEEVQLPWIDSVATGRSYIWQQDSTSCYIGRRTQCRLWENLCNHITFSIGHQTLQIAIPLIIVCRVQLGSRPTKLCATPKMNWRQRKRQYLLT